MAAGSGTMLLDAADRVRAATNVPPTTELGTTQRYGPWAAPIMEEWEVARDLAWPRNVQNTYPGMLNDAQVDGLYRGATLPIRAYRWWLDPNGASDSVVQRISSDYGLPIGPDGTINVRRRQNRFRFDRHLEDALRAIAYGHYFFEQVGDIGDDGLWHVRKLAPRPPRTIIDIKPDRDGGLAYIKVPALDPKREGWYSGLTGVSLPVDRLVAYVWDQEGANWRGRSMLRSCYRPWKLKDRVLRVGAINIERAGGVPYIEAPDGATTKQIQELHQLAAAFRVGENAGAALPHGAQLKFANAAGGDQAINYVRLMNEEMARAWLMMFLQSGQTSSGHGSTQQVGQQIDYFALVQHAIADWICDVFTEHQIEDDVEWNDGPDEQYTPLLRYTPDTGSPVSALADQLDDAQREGALPADSPTAAMVRAAAGERGRGRRRPTRAATAATDDPASLAQTDFAALQQTYQEALTELTEAWQAVQAEQIDDLVAQITQATTVAELAAITPAVAGAAILAEALTAVVEHGAQSVVDEAAAQGHDLAAPDLADAHATITDAAEATAALLARQLGESAASKALGLAGGGAAFEDVAGQVREYLEGLQGAVPTYEIGGLVSHAQNEGRFTAMEQSAPDDARYYASELNDTNTCTFCAVEDDTEFDSLADARLDYPAGGYVACEGGKKCRGTVVMVLPETPGQA